MIDMTLCKDCWRVYCICSDKPQSTWINNCKICGQAQCICQKPWCTSEMLTNAISAHLANHHTQLLGIALSIKNGVALTDEECDLVKLAILTALRLI